jgi:integrase
MKLTRANIDGLALKPGKLDAIFFDDELKGFGIRLRAGGKRSWIIQYKVAGNTRRLTLGDVRKIGADLARREAKNRLAKVTLGGDPQADKIEARNAGTLGDVIDTYLATKRATIQPRTFTEISRYLTKTWKPLRATPIQGVTRQAAALHLAKITVKPGPVVARAARAALHAFFTWAAQSGIVETNIVADITKVKGKPPRDRKLSDAELAAVWRACGEDDFGRIVRLLILTGARRNEIGAVRWPEISGEAIHLPGERSKNHRAHKIPLSDTALAIIAAVPRRLSNDCLFGEGGNGFQGWSRYKIALDARLPEMSAWVLHDLRRTVATGMVKLGVPPHIVEALLNHAKPKIVATYQQYDYTAEVRAALVAWAEHIKTLTASGHPLG